MRREGMETTGSRGRWHRIAGWVALMAMLFPVLTSTLHAQPADEIVLPERLTNPDAGTPGGTGQGNRMLVDGIAAVVGNEVILISDIYEQFILLKQQGAGKGMSDNVLMQEVLNEQIMSKLLVVKAREDSVTVSDDLVNAQTEEYVNRLIARAGSASALEEMYGKKMEEIRTEVRGIMKEKLLVQVLQQRKFADLKVTDRDLQDFYVTYRDSLPTAPEQVEIAHIYLQAPVSDEQKEKTKELAARIADSIRNGGNFAEFARRYSVDPGSASKGGEYGWTAEGRFVREYEQAVKGLEINEISKPFETQYGIHIVQLLDRRPGEYRSRHILFPLEAGPAERQRLIDTLNMIRTRVANGESFEALARTYSDDVTSKYNGGVLDRFPTKDLGEYHWVTDSLNIGDVSTPRPFSPSITESGYHIVKLVRVIAPHRMTLEEDRANFEPLVKQWKEQKELLAWIDQLRNEIYWDIKYDFQ